MELNPCPFCGGPARVGVHHMEPDGYSVWCLRTSAADHDACAVAPQTLPMISEAAAIEAWNRRDGASSLVPNDETIEAMQAARRGETIKVGNPENLITSLIR